MDICLSNVNTSSPTFFQRYPEQRVHMVREIQVEAGVLSVARSRNPVNQIVALAVVLGSRTVEMSVTQSLTIHGLRASRPAKVSQRKTKFCVIQNMSHCA